MKRLEKQYSVEGALEEIARAREAFDVYNFRQQTDINCDTKSVPLRYQNLSQEQLYLLDTLKSDRVLECIDTHLSIRFPECMRIAYDVLRYVGGDRLGRVMLVSLPAGGVVKPHVDKWHYCSYYTRYVIPLQSEQGNSFTCGNVSMWMLPGNLYTFPYQVTHSATNRSEKERLTLFVDVHTSDLLGVIP